MTTKTKEARRKAFEAMVVERIGKDVWSDYPEWCLERSVAGFYTSTKVEGMWLGFNAALDSICVELPAHEDGLVKSYGPLLYRDEVVDALESAGVSYK